MKRNDEITYLTEYTSNVFKAMQINDKNDDNLVNINSFAFWPWTYFWIKKTLKHVLKLNLKLNLIQKQQK